MKNLAIIVLAIVALYVGGSIVSGFSSIAKSNGAALNKSMK